MDFDGRPSVADAEFDDPLRRPRPRPTAPAVILFCLPLLMGGDLVVDALQPQGMPDPHSVESGLSSVLSGGIRGVRDLCVASVPTSCGSSTISPTSARAPASTARP
ncbi:hypothetical protein AB0C98_10120 [Streptomyces sp. NPDC048558]|uniref:hypothetical protein n=1 Tax=Streptomyces sp. NPDC048558 TaxID=3155759 RepID=UPI0033D34F3A